MYLRSLAFACAFLGTVAVAAQEPPDFSGAWTAYRGNAAGGGAGANRAVGELKLKPDAQAAVETYRKLVEGTDFSPGNACVGYGMPESMLGSGGGYPMEIIQRPDHLFIVNELHNEMRRIFLPVTAGDPAEQFPERNGYSIAHWEGERLIVETTRLKTQIDTRYPHSAEATIREEYYFDTPLPDGTKVLVGELVMEDPLWLEEPYRATKRWQALAGYHVKSYECSEPKWLDELQKLYDAAGLEMPQQ